MRRFGNCVDDGDKPFIFAVNTQGPGSVDVAVDCPEAGPSRVELLARRAGAYTISLLTSTHDTLGARPIQVGFRLAGGLVLSVQQAALPNV